jgi:RNA polymerase sigma-70 factor (ECF subfamily)
MGGRRRAEFVEFCRRGIEPLFEPFAPKLAFARRKGSNQMPKWRLLQPKVASASAPAAANPRQGLEAAELELLAGVRRGRQADFEALYRIYHPRLQRFLGQMSQRPELVEEALDDTMMVVWQRADSFDGRSKLSTWIFGIAYRKALKALGKQDLPQEDLDADLQADPAPNPEQRLGLSQVQQQLRRALAELSPDHRAVVELCYFQDMAYGEIAQVVDCPDPPA